MAKVEKFDSKIIISKLGSTFARFGIPKIVFTDNGTQLVSNEMKKFAEDFDFTIVTRSPPYPQSNGLAEAALKITKKILNSPRPAVALMNYRATLTAVGYNPAQLLFNRQVGTKIPSVKLDNHIVKRADLEDREKQRRSRMSSNFNRTKGARLAKELSPGRRVFVEDVNKKGSVIRKRSEPRPYDVQLENGTELRRNRKSLRHLRSRYPDWPELSESVSSTLLSSPKASASSSSSKPSPTVPSQPSSTNSSPKRSPPQIRQLLARSVKKPINYRAP